MTPSDEFNNLLAMNKPKTEGDSMIFGLLLVLGGATWLLDQLGILAVSPRVIAAGLLVALGLCLMITSRTGRKRRDRGLILVGVLLAVALVASSSDHVSLADGVGERTITPLDSRQLVEAQRNGQFDLSLGELTIDLTRMDDFRTRKVKATLGMGEMRIIIPEGPHILLKVHGRSADVTLFGRRLSSGAETDINATAAGSPNGPKLILDLEIGIGAVEIVRGAPNRSKPDGRTRI